MRLNLATRRFHADVDEPWLGLLRVNLTIANYRDVLAAAYGLIAPFESACKYTPGLAQLVDFRQLNRAGLIAQDLLALGQTPAQVAAVPTCPGVVMFHGIAEALGWLYVIERSTLLQGSVRRHVVKQLPVQGACSFLAAYDGHVGDHWVAFGRVLDRAAHDDQIANDIVTASCDAFAACRKWFEDVKNPKRSAG
jgi:heme oxygenase